MKRILTFFLFIWIIILAIPLFWMLFPIKVDAKNIGPSLSMKIYPLVEIISLDKEDLLDRKIIRQSQLQIVNKNFGRDPFYTEEFKNNIIKTTSSSLQTKIAYYKIKKEVSGDLQLEGISYTDKAKIALINNVLVSEGDMINDYTVIKIRETGVELKKSDAILSLKIKEHNF